MQVSFGVLAACFNVQGEGISYCVIQLFESVDTFGTQVINEYDCPLLSLICLFRCVLPHSIIQSVCIVHECTPTCMVKHVTTTSQVERLSVRSQKRMFVHDFGNTLYSFNIYCMHSSD